MSTRTRRRGLTLAELMVSCALFVGLMSVLFLCERMAQSSQTKVDTNSDVYRMAMGAMERIKTEVRGAYVVGLNVTTGELDYQVPQLDPTTGLLSDDGSGHPIWLPPAPDCISILLDGNGNVIKTRANVRYMLGNLGPLGTLKLSLPDLTGDDVIDVAMHAQIDQPGSNLRSASYDLNFTLLFPNQR